uniref:Uncharacterized protein n=1 Tax=Heterorhabditis bacteriophora TaxID=37862 RepID=A0A1I7X9J9_HETBA
MHINLIVFLAIIKLGYCEGELYMNVFKKIFELRIHENAERGTRLTMGIEMQRKIKPMKNCFGQLETDVDWLDYKLCAGNRMHSLPFHIHITHKNHHPPTFSQTNYHFYVPVTLPVGANIGKMEVRNYL